MNTLAKPRLDSALEFLREVTAPGLHGTLVAIDPETGACVGRAYKLDSLTAASEFLESNSHRNLYWTPNPLKRAVNKKPVKGDVSEMVWVHLDLDDPSPGALAQLRSYRFPPTIIIFSGGGYQAFWQLRVPVRVDANVDTLEAANKRVAEDLGGDPGTWNLDRIMRLPGTTNWPTKTKLARGRVPTEATLIERHSDRVYDLTDFTTTVAPFPTSTDRSVDLMTKASADVRAGLDDATIHVRLDDHPHAASQKDSARAVQRCIDKARGYWSADSVGPTTEQLSVQEMLMRLVYVEKEPIIVDLHNVAIKLRMRAFHGKYAASKEGSGKNEAQSSYLFAAHPSRPTTHDIGFDPSARRFFEHGGKTLLNMWTEPVWPAVDLALAQPFIDHLEFLIPDAKPRNDLIDWLAAARQQPGTRPHYHFLLLAEPEGTGRSWLGDALREIWSNDYAISVDMHKMLDDNFNSELSRKILVYVNEVKATASERFNHRERLKSLLSDTWITINEKNLARWQEKFCARFLMFTNSTAALPITERDRRVYAVRCTSTVRSPEYYKQLYARLSDQQFLAAVWALFKARDLRSYNPGAVAPLTSTKLEMAEDGRTNEQQMAVEFARTAPFDVIHGPDLYRVVVPAHDHETKKERDARLAAVSNALRDVGVTSATHKLRTCETAGKDKQIFGPPKRVWIFRNVDQWRDASTAKLREGIAAARAALDEHQWRLDVALGAWSKEDAAPEVKHEY